MSKITEKDFGKKFTVKDWNEDMWFIPLGFSLDGKCVIGEVNDRYSMFYPSDCENWIQYKEKEFLMSPGIVKQGDTIYWSEHEFSKTIPLKIVITNAKITNNFLVDKNAGEIEGDLWILVKEYPR